MRRLLLCSMAITLFQVTTAQVGINNTDPKAQLDITAGASASEMDGLLIPRLDEYPTGVGADQDGMLVFITGDGTPTKGFYYWDNNAGPAAWIPIEGTPGADNQTIDNFVLNNTTGILSLEIEDDGIAPQTVDITNITGFGGSDNQTIDNLSLSGTTLRLSLEDDGQPLQQVNLASLQDGTGTDNQTIDNLSLSGTTLRLSLEDDGQPLQTLDLSSLQGSDDDWYVSGTTNTPTSINQDIYTNGLIGIGESIPGSPLDILHNGPERIVSKIIGTHTTPNNNIYEGLRVEISSPNSTQTTKGIFARNFNGLFKYGLDAEATGVGTINFGVSANATGATTNYGISARAFGGSTNLAGLFGNSAVPGSGNVRITDELDVLGSLRFRIGSEAAGRILSSDAQGIATWIDPSTIGDGTGTDNQNLVTPTLSGTTLNLNIEDGTGTSIDLASLQDGTGTDNQNIQGLGFNAVTNILTVGIENGVADTVNLSALDSGGDISAVIAGAGLTGGGATGNVTITANANNGLNVDAAQDRIQLGGALTEATTITHGTNTLSFNLDNTGDFAIQDNGTDVFFVEDSGEIGLGTSSPIYPLHMVETGAYNRGFQLQKIETSAAETSGIFIEKTGLGTGRSHAIFTDVDGSGTGQKYGMFNRITSIAAGNQYGVRNFINGNTTSFQFGTFNNLANAATGNQYGVYNGMRGTAAANKYGVYNEFQEPISSADETVGVRNRFTNGTPGAEGMNGIWTDFALPANGNYYGIRNEYGATATGTGVKYGTFNSISNAAGGTHYGTYNTVSSTNGWAGYFLGRNYISERLSIGETSNTVGRMAVRTNSFGTNVHIEVKEQEANDGSRIRFSNAFETTNYWTLFGRADNTTADGQFNIHHSATGNIITATGDGDVGITGDADTDFHVFHGNNGNADGMKLQNTSDNTWWRMYVSSGSDDLRLYNSNNGTTIMGAFNDATGAYTNTSDRRLKKDFKELYFSWDNFMQLAPLTYKYKVDDQPTNYIGMVAQDVEKIYPELITYQEKEDIYHMDYSATGVVAIKGVQELKKEVEMLKNENLQLKQKLSILKTIEARLLALENDTNNFGNINDITISEEKK